MKTNIIAITSKLFSESVIGINVVVGFIAGAPVAATIEKDKIVWRSLDYSASAKVMVFLDTNIKRINYGDNIQTELHVCGSTAWQRFSVELI